jgi:hypothetical protein
MRGISPMGPMGPIGPSLRRSRSLRLASRNRRSGKRCSQQWNLLYFVYKVFEHVMFQDKAAKSLTWLLTCLCAWTFASGAQDLVVCLGPDGHVAIEPVHDAPCAAAPEAPGVPAVHGGCVQERHHSDCVDILFPVQSGFAAAHDHRATAKNLMPRNIAACETAVHLDRAVAEDRVLPPDCSLDFACARTLRSTLLLI